MAKAVLKVKPGKLVNTTKAKVYTAADPKEAIAELVPVMHKEHDKLKVVEAQAKAIKKSLSEKEDEVRSLVDTIVGEEESYQAIAGDKSIEISPKTRTRYVPDENKETLILMLEELEEGLALKLAKFALGDLDKVFSPEELEKVTKVKLGNRRIKY